jgi:hypothetical protein
VKREEKTFSVWTPDFGKVRLRTHGEDSRALRFLEEVLEQGLWSEFRQFPIEVLERLLPQLTLTPSRRRLLEIWIEEAPNRAAS